MSELHIASLDPPWPTSNPAVLVAHADPDMHTGAGAASMRISASTAPAGAFVEYQPQRPLDLSAYDELRFWVRGSRPARGSTAEPFLLEFSFFDAADASAESHRWFVPLGRSGHWEQRRIGIERERRSAVQRLRLSALTELPFDYWIDDLLAVREEWLADVERALIRDLEARLRLPGLSDVAFAEPVSAGATRIAVVPSPAFAAGHRLRLTGGSAGPEIRDLLHVAHAQDRTTLEFDSSQPLQGDYPSGAASTLVPAIAAAEALPAQMPMPALLLSLTDVREELGRTTYYTQRDSFRLRDGRPVCSVRPAPRAYSVDYQILVRTAQREQQLFIHSDLLALLSSTGSVRINGASAPVTILPPPPLEERVATVESPVYLRVATRRETAIRQDQAWIRSAVVGAALNAAREDAENISIER